MTFQSRITYTERAAYCYINSVAAQCFNVMARKHSNLIVAADVTTCTRLLALAKLVGPHICALKTHLDLLEDYDIALPTKLVALAQKYDFLLFEDRKFADIGGVIRAQWQGGLYRLAQWVDMVTVHTLSGPGALDAIVDSDEQYRTAVFVIPQLSTRGALTSAVYRAKTLDMMHGCQKRNPGKVCGVITQRRTAAQHDETLVYAMPGVKLIPTHNDRSLKIKFGQQYKTPHTAIVDDGADVIIVGSGILQAPNLKLATQAYQRAGWNAYQCRIGESK